MKVIVRYTILFFLISQSISPSLAQNLYGYRLGGLVSKFRGVDVSPNIRSNIGFVAGGFVDLNISQQIKFRIEANFMQKGAKFDEVIRTTATKEMRLYVNEKLNCFSVCPLAKVTVGNPVNLFLFTGFDFSILITGNRKINAYIDSLSIDPGVFYDFQYKQVTTDIFFGAGLKLDRMFIEGRYCIGLTNIYRENIRETRNGWISLSVGYVMNENILRKKGYKAPKSKGSHKPPKTKKRKKNY